MRPLAAVLLAPLDGMLRRRRLRVEWCAYRWLMHSVPRATDVVVAILQGTPRPQRKRLRSNPRDRRGRSVRQKWPERSTTTCCSSRCCESRLRLHA